VAVVIRPIERDDVPGAVLVAIGGAATARYEDPDDVDAYWTAVEETRVRRGDVFVADLDGEVVGLCQVLVFQHFQHVGGWCCEVETVHVRADLRGRGVGAMLLAAAEALALERGCYRIQLTSNAVRADAHRFYERQGYDPSHQGFKKYLGS
jgi:GNAT superfamily N-acetyltransferase